jgi:hypothetical protein
MIGTGNIGGARIMATTGFHSEWVTIHGHRILLECRASFPDEQMRFVASVAVEMCEHGPHTEARVLTVFFDDKASVYAIKIGTTDPKDDVLSTRLEHVIQTIYHGCPVTVEVIVIPEGNRDSDHYEHMEHLSVAAGICVDRFKYRDEPGEPPR